MTLNGFLRLCQKKKERERKGREKREGGKGIREAQGQEESDIRGG